MQWIRSKFCNLTRRQIAFLVVGVVLLFVFFLPSFAHAGMSVKEILVLILGNIIQWFLDGVSKIMLWAMNAVVAIAMYNDFAGATAVSIGWILIRDITNMLLVALMLMMAFGTLLNRGDLLGDYKSLPKFVIIAIVINFSKMITLLVIDLGQVVMLSFVAAFQNTAGGNFLKAFGMTKWLEGSLSGSAGDYAGTIIIALFLALVLAVIVLVVMIVFLIYLVVRIAMLWMLIIFSPLAFALKLMPTRGQKFYGQWWEYLVSTIIAGPLLAFFLWLTLITAGVSNGSLGTEVMADAAAIRAAQQGELASGQNLGAEGNIAIMKGDALMTFFISVMMLLLGLKITSEMGGVVGGAIAGGGLGFMKKHSKNFVKKRYERSKEKLANTAIPFTGGQTYAGRTKAKEAIRQEKLTAGQKYAELQSRKAFGDTKGVAKLESSIVSDERENVKGMSGAEKIQALNNAPKGSLEEQAIKLELASSGYYNDKLHEVDGAIGGNKEFGIKLKAEIKKSGGQILDVKEGQTAEEVIQEKFASGDKDILKGLPDRVKQTRSSSGEVKMADPHALKILEAIPPDQFGKYSDSQKQSINDSFMLAMKNNSDTTNPEQVAQLASLKSKFEELNGLAGTTYDDAGGGAGVADFRLVSSTVTEKKNAKGDVVRKAKTTAQYASTVSKLQERQTASVSRQTTGLSAASVREQRKVDGAVSPADRELSRGVSAMSGANRSTFDGSVATLTESVPAALAGTSTTKWGTAATTVATQRTTLQNRFNSLDAEGHETELRDKSGAKINNADNFKQSSLKKALDNLEAELTNRQSLVGSTGKETEITESDNMITQLQKEVNELTIHAQRRQGKITGAGSRVGRGERETARKKLSDSSTKIKNASTAAQSSASESDQAAAIRDLRSELAQGMSHLQRSSTDKIPAAARGEIGALKKELAVLKAKLNAKRMKPSSRDNAADLADLKRIEDEFKRFNDMLG